LNDSLNNTEFVLNPNRRASWCFKREHLLIYLLSYFF
jgi:hypothetical protein